jgi:hypothetical protein
MPPTPHFVRWTLARTCGLREGTDVTDPDQAERQLRVLRAYADAAHAGRCVDGVCFDDSGERGFFAAEVLDAYGGREFVAQECEECPANTLAARRVGNLAGCYGWLVLEDDLLARLEETLANRETGTMPRWYGLWLDRAPTGATMEQHSALWDKVAGAGPVNDAGLSEFRAALRQGIPLYWALAPRGAADGLTWSIVAHCPHCRAGMTPREHRCGVCGFVGRCAPQRTRQARGPRPFQTLERILGADQAEELVSRFREGEQQVE